MKRLAIEIDFQLKSPIYQQVLTQLEHRILTKRLKPGNQLPTVRTLADELDINFNTVARVYRALHHKGLISVQHGRGTYVLPILKEKEDLIREELLEKFAKFYAEQAQSLGFSIEKARNAVMKTMEE